MHCKQARDLLFLAYERELTDDERSALRAHIKECPECHRFVEAMRHWSSPPPPGAEGLGFVTGGMGVRHASTEFTERVLASVRPLPPPWVYHATQRDKQGPHIIGVAIGALVVGLTFVAVSLALIVAVATGGQGVTAHATFETVVRHEASEWFGTLPNDLAHVAITLAALLVFAALALRWFHAFAMRMGHDRSIDYLDTKRKS